jgi:4-amino-4-deoxy-L-arabinose transferase-like glycosyltransferase
MDCRRISGSNRLIDIIEKASGQPGAFFLVFMIYNMRMKVILEGIKKYKVMVYLAVYFLVNLLFLTKFPFMHSDESWLSGLTQSMMSGGPAATESFFDLLPRNPHAIKTIFHAIQALFTLIFGYNLFTFRLISLLSGIGALILFNKIVFRITENSRLSFLAMVALSVCIQFVYASHFARQEILILAFMLAALLYFINHIDNRKIIHDAVTALITGLAIGIHPNSFLISLVIGSIYIFYIFIERKLKIKNLLVYLLTTGIVAGIFVGISYIMDPNFIQNYLAYGSELGVTVNVAVKYEGLVPYYLKLFRQSSVTYYTPNIRVEFFVGLVAAVGCLIAGFKNKKYWFSLFPLIAINLGYIIIGRYSQPAVLFIFPFAILALYQLSKVLRDPKKVFPILICLGFLINSVIGILPWLNNDYNDYLSQLRKGVPEGSKTLANLNTGYLFDEGEFLDYRNLAYLDANKMDFGEYVESRGIEYIIYPEEMDFIYERRPVWNIVYGNLYPYYEDMTSFLEEQCSLVHEFESPYGMRIVRFIGDGNKKIRIYRID